MPNEDLLSLIVSNPLEQAKLPTIPPDLQLLAQPYLEGKKLPDRILSLILRVAMREAEVTRLNALIDTADYSDGALIWKSDHEKIVAKEVAQLKADNERLKAPVSDEESRAAGWTSCGQNFEQLRRIEVGALLTARTGGSNVK